MKPTLKILAILILTALIIVGYALIGDRPLIIGDWGFRQISLAALEYDEDEAEETSITSSKDSTAKAAEKMIARTDTAKQVIMLFGDSMTAPLSFRIKDYATENGHTLKTVCWYSSSCGAWANTDTLQHYMDIIKPTHIFICLGSNQLFEQDLEKLEKDIRKIKKKCAGIPTIWIGPPNWKKDTGINDILLKVWGDDGYYPSLNLTYERRSDGAHPTDASAAKWFDAIAKWMNEGHSLHNINLKTPTKKGKQRLYVIAAPKERY